MSQLGTILRNRREELNLTQAEVSRQTNIRVNIIDALEKGKNSILPPTYLRSFSKSYWQFLRLPMEDFEKAFAESGIMPAQQEQSFIGTLINPEKEKEKEYTPPAPLKAIESPKYSPRLVSGIISAAMILILIVGVYYLFVKDIVDDTPVDPGTQTESTGTEDNSSDNGGALLEIFDEEQSKDSIVLEVTAKNKTWFTINADGKSSESVVLEAGQSGRWTSIEYFTLSISNNGGAVFKRNGQIIPNIGKEGTIIREMKITANDITNSAMPYKDNESTEKVQTKSGKGDGSSTSTNNKPTVKKSSEVGKSTGTKKTATTPKKPATAKQKEATPSTSKKKSETSAQPKKKTESASTAKAKKSSSEKTKSSSTKKKSTEKSKSADKKKSTTKAKETKKSAKSDSGKKAPEKKKSSEAKKVETPKPMPIGNPRR